MAVEAAPDFREGFDEVAGVAHARTKLDCPFDRPQAPKLGMIGGIAFAFEVEGGIEAEADILAAVGPPDRAEDGQLQEAQLDDGGRIERVVVRARKRGRDTGGGAQFKHDVGSRRRRRVVGEIRAGHGRAGQPRPERRCTEPRVKKTAACLSNLLSAA